MGTTMNRIILASIFFASFIVPATASADVLQIWARGDGGFMGGDQDLHYFQVNDVGPEYGFAVGAEVLFIDIFANINLHPDGSMFNLLGIGYHLDLVPVDLVALGPIAQTAYFFAPTGVDGETDDRGIIFRGGGFFELNVSKFVALGAEGFGGYALITSDADAGFMWSGSGYLKLKFGF